MTDLSQTIAPKSDQLNADDLIGRTMTIKVSRVSRADGEQPVAINFEGDGGKPYKPCKSMRRVLVNVWGADGHAYVGRRMTIYRDEEVQFGGMKVGGIRISHMSEIKAPVTMALTATRAQRKPFTVKPLVEERAPARDAPGSSAQPRMTRAQLFSAAREAAAKGQTAFDDWIAPLPEGAYQALGDIWPELQESITRAGGDQGFPGDDALDAARERESAA